MYLKSTWRWRKKKTVKICSQSLFSLNLQSYTKNNKFETHRIIDKLIGSGNLKIIPKQSFISMNKLK